MTGPRPRPPHDLLALTAELVDIPSVSRDEAAITAHLEHELRALGHLDLTRVGDNLVARTELGRPSRLVLAGHTDTVPAAGNERARIEGDTLWGLGAADMKGGLAVMLELARTMPSPAVDVTYVFYAREEIDASASGLGELFAARPDLMVGDAFGSLSVPWHLTTHEFIDEIDRVLRPNGVYVINVIDYPPLEFVEAETATLLEVFAHVGVIAPYRYLDGGSGGNFVLVASQSPVAWDGVQAGLNERSLNEIAWFGDQARDFADGAPVLRDDYAPVDQLIGRP